MSTTVRQGNDFYEAMLPNNRDFLDEAIVWIKDNLEPSDVFDKEQLREWAVDNGYASIGEQA